MTEPTPPASPGPALTVLIPVRVPADIMPTVLGEPRVLPPDHPACLLLCAACAEPVGAVRPMAVVYVGTEPAQRLPGGAMRGSGVPVHADCAGIAPAADRPEPIDRALLLRVADGLTRAADQLWPDGGSVMHADAAKIRRLADVSLPVFPASGPKVTVTYEGAPPGSGARHWQQEPAVPSTGVRKTLRRWAYAAGHIESELDGAVDRMYKLIARDVLSRTTPEPHAADHEPVWTTALDVNDESARDADGKTWTHCGVCGVRQGIARDLTLSPAPADPVGFVSPAAEVRAADGDSVACWHTEPGTPCDWNVCRQPERLARGDRGADPADPTH